MSFPLSSLEISALVNAPSANVELTWPAVDVQLEALGMYSNAVRVAALATIRVECPPFLPVHEYGSEAYLNKMYDTRADLGNTPDRDGDGARYCGRGLIQVTGKSNYKRYGDEIGVDLVARPERALEPEIAARILALYFADHSLETLALAEEWTAIRKKVNGGTNGLAPFLGYVQKLNAAIANKG